jgi:hypothetical protein
MIRGVWESVFEDGAWEGFDFGEADRLPAKGMPSDAGGFHAGADGEVTEGLADGCGLCGFIHWVGLW